MNLASILYPFDIKELKDKKGNPFYSFSLPKTKSFLERKRGISDIKILLGERTITITTTNFFIKNGKTLYSKGRNYYCISIKRGCLDLLRINRPRKNRKTTNIRNYNKHRQNFIGEIKHTIREYKVQFLEEDVRIMCYNPLTGKFTVKKEETQEIGIISNQFEEYIIKFLSILVNERLAEKS